MDSDKMSLIVLLASSERAEKQQQRPGLKNNDVHGLRHVKCFQNRAMTMVDALGAMTSSAHDPHQDRLGN